MPNALSLPRISTNVRFAASHLLFPELANAWAERMFLTPPRGKHAAASALDLIDAENSWLEHKGRHIAMWSWGARSKDAPAVLLAHGWAGHAAQMRGFVFPLLCAGYRVIAYDQPAHGVSEGRLTGLPDFAAVMTEVAWHHGGVHGVIAHSMGGAGTALAIAHGLRVGRVVTIGASLDFSFFSRQFARWYWIPQRVVAARKSAIYERCGVRCADLDPAKLAPRLTAPALVIHDRHDRAVPWHQGASFARGWPGARLYSAHGRGHRRILKDERVASLAAEFIAGRSGVADVAAPAMPNPSPLY